MVKGGGRGEGTKRVLPTPLPSQEVGELNVRVLFGDLRIRQTPEPLVRYWYATGVFWQAQVASDGGQIFLARQRATKSNFRGTHACHQVLVRTKRPCRAKI